MDEALTAIEELSEHCNAEQVTHPPPDEILMGMAAKRLDELSPEGRDFANPNRMGSLCTLADSIENGKAPDYDDLLDAVVDLLDEHADMVECLSRCCGLTRGTRKGCPKPPSER